MIEPKHLIVVGCPVSLVKQWLHPVRETCERYEILTKERASMFLAQVAHESDSFRRTVENLNYSALGLRRTFGRYFPTDETAQEFARQPEKIANRVYANRLGNGDESSGDGWKYRGRGLIQLTGKDNVRAFSLAYFGDERLVEDPSPLEEPYLAANSAGWFWKSKGLNELADALQFEEVTKRINGGLNGLADRQARWNMVFPLFGA